MSGEVDAADPLRDDAYRDLFRAEPDAPEPSATGRLFRTYRVGDVTDALIAIKPEQARRLRTMQPEDAAPDSPPVEVAEVEVTEEPVAESRSKKRPKRSRAPGLRPGAVYVIDILVTVLVAFIESFVRGELGWLTGVALLVVSVYTATVVRMSDWVVVVIAPPIAFFMAAITAGQMNLSDTSVINRVAQVFFTLGTSWFWILGSIALAFATTVVRRRRSP
jgi:hypothetical protein